MVAPAHPAPFAAARLVRRRSRAGSFALALILATLVNLALVVGLSQMTAVTPEPRVPPLTVMALHQVTPPAIDDPEPEDAAESDAAPATALPLVALPELDLAEAPADGALAMPDLPPGDLDRDLPRMLPGIATAPALAIPSASAAPSTSGFDQSPRLLGAFDLDRFYPRRARARAIEGRSTISLAIGADGRVTAFSVLASEPAGVFDEALRQLASSLRFAPALAAGKPVAATLTLPIIWTLGRR